MPSARPSTAPADSRQAPGRSRLAAPLRRTARAATLRLAIRRPAARSNSRAVCSAAVMRDAMHVHRREADVLHAPTCARTGNGTERPARRCGAADAASRDPGPGRLRVGRRPLRSCPPANGSSPAIARRIVVFPEPDGPRSAIRSPGRASRLRCDTSVPPSARAARHRAAVSVLMRADILHRRSSTRASAASGSDIARYSTAQIAPGITQLPRLVAKIWVCLVSSTTVSTETSDESLSSATKSLVIGASASRNACGPRINRSVWNSVKPSVRDASSCPTGTASSAPR